MKKLLSLPPNLVECFHDIEKADQTEWFCTSDPIGSKLGSGGGTAWLLEACCQKVCLLYTSPSPRDAHESRMPSSA